jgi:TRAP-type C4-dicarboxylate transport system permease small subunit
MHLIASAFDRIERTINAMIIVLLMLMTIVIFYQVVLRYVFHGANIWAEEFARYSFIWIVMLGSSSAIRRFQHIRIDFLVQCFPGNVQKIISLCNYLMILVFLGVLMFSVAKSRQRPLTFPPVSAFPSASCIPVFLSARASCSCLRWRSCSGII